MGTEKKTPKYGDRVTWSGYARSGELMVLEGVVTGVNNDNRAFVVRWDRAPWGRRGKTDFSYAIDVPFSIFDKCGEGQEWTLGDSGDVPRGEDHAE